MQSLFGCLLYMRSGLEKSPYAHVLETRQWTDICEVFMRDACALLSLSVESPLSVWYVSSILLSAISFWKVEIGCQLLNFVQHQRGLQGAASAAQHKASDAAAASSQHVEHKGGAAGEF